MPKETAETGALPPVGDFEVGDVEAEEDEVVNAKVNSLPAGAFSSVGEVEAEAELAEIDVGAKVDEAEFDEANVKTDELDEVDVEKANVDETELDEVVEAEAE